MVNEYVLNYSGEKVAEAIDMALRIDDKIRQYQTDVSNAVKGAVSGNTLTLTDISPIEHVMDVRVRSKNIIPCPAEKAAQTINGVTFTHNTNGKLMLNGTATSDAEYPIVSSNEYLVLQGDTDYTVSGVGDGSGDVVLHIKDITNDVSYEISNNVEVIRFSGNNPVSCQVSIKVKAGTVKTNSLLSPQIEIGTEATTYTPYVNVADLTVTRYGETETDNAITYTTLEDGSVEGVYPLYPVTTLTTSQKARVLIDCIYNKDINSVLADKSDILALQSDVDANKEKIADVEAIAKGRATGYVFDTKDDMDAWLEDSENVAKLVLGDNLYIRATDVPDYWWDGATAQELEAQKVNLSEYELPEAGSDLGGVKTGGDVTISGGIITVEDNSHSHTIENVTGLQDALDNIEKPTKISELTDDTSSDNGINYSKVAESATRAMQDMYGQEIHIQDLLDKIDAKPDTDDFPQKISDLVDDTSPTSEFKINAAHYADSAERDSNGDSISSSYARIVHTHTIEDVTGLQDALDEVSSGGSADKSEVANAVKKTAGGYRYLEITDISPFDHLLDVKIKTKNLLPFVAENAGTSTTINGVAFRQYTTGIIINGTCTESAEYVLSGENNPFVLTGGESYTVSGIGDGSGQVFLKITDVVNNAVYIITEAVKTITIRGSGSITCHASIVANAGTYENLRVYPQIEYGTEATDFERYIDPENIAVTINGAYYTPSADGTVEGVNSLYPTTTIDASYDEVYIECNYNGDINKNLISTEELELKQDKLTDEQLENIDNVPDKADKSEVANAVKEVFSGNPVTITDMSPLENSLILQISPGEEEYSNLIFYMLDENDEVLGSYAVESDGSINGLKIYPTMKFRVENFDGDIVGNISGSYNKDMETLLNNKADTEELELKQDKLTDEQLENIDNVSDKVDKTELENFTEKTVSGQGAVIISGISSSQSTLTVNGTAGRISFEIYGQNIWDEEWETDNIDPWIWSKNPIPVIEGVSYYLYCGKELHDDDFGTINYYDADKNILSDLTHLVKRNSVITIPAGCYYIGFKTNTLYGASYNNDICINVYDVRINGTYAPYQGKRSYETGVHGDSATNAIIEPFYPITTIYSTDMSVECTYYKDLYNAFDNLSKELENQNKSIMELLYTGTTTEEVSTISVTTDMAGDAFELEELYAVVKIPSPNDISPYFYLTNDIKTYTLPYGQTGTNNSTFIITWSLNNPYFKVEQYQYYNVFKTAKIIDGRIDSAAKGFKVHLYVKDDVQQVFPVGTEIEVWGRKVQ